jgi:hypothetical protein
MERIEEEGHDMLDELEVINMLDITFKTRSILL